MAASPFMAVPPFMAASVPVHPAGTARAIGTASIAATAHSRGDLLEDAMDATNGAGHGVPGSEGGGAGRGGRRDVNLIRVDVTTLTAAAVGSGYRLLLDTGTFHGLSDAQRVAMGRQISAIASPDAALILDCFAPRRRAPLPRGADRSGIERAFSGWDITDVEVADTEPNPMARMFRLEERFYCLRRKPGHAT
jgi:hypothetical protein